MLLYNRIDSACESYALHRRLVHRDIIKLSRYCLVAHLVPWAWTRESEHVLPTSTLLHILTGGCVTTQRFGSHWLQARPTCSPVLLT